MSHPWENIDLNIYEAHMSLDGVAQLQALHSLMEGQLTLGGDPVMILGVAGGNGLDLIDPRSESLVYGVDVNSRYLAACQERYPQLGARFIPIQADLTDSSALLPHAELLLANLLVEYIGYEAFCRVLTQVGPERVSVVLQVNEGDAFVSDSPYLHVFDRLNQIHQDLDEARLSHAVGWAGYAPIFRSALLLPNGKGLLRLDYQRRSRHD